MIHSKYPDVREVTYPYGRHAYDKMSLEYLTQEAELANRVRSGCLTILKGLPLAEMGLKERPYLKGFQEWFEKEKPQLLYENKLLMDQALKYQGECSFVISFGKDPISLEIKTHPKFCIEWPLQLSAYRYLLQQHHIPVKQAMLVQLDAILQPKVIAFDNKDLTRNWKIFKGLLEGYHYFQS